MDMEEIIEIKTITELHDMLGYPKPKHPLITLIDFSKLEFSPNHLNKKIVTSFYSISLKTHLECDLKYGRSYYDFQEGSLMFLAPQQVIIHTGDSVDVVTGGWGLFFHPDLIRRSSLGNRMKDYSFFSYDSNEALHLSESEKETITSIVKKIEEEYSMNIDIYSQELIVSNIELLLNYCKRFYGRQFITRSSQNKDVIIKFEQLLKDYYESDIHHELGVPSVKYCAEKLSFSPNYLSDLLKKETGKNTQEHIHYFLIERAKNLLLSTGSSVSEIAYDLGFEYPQYFSKMFKSKTGKTPAQYRNMN